MEKCLGPISDPYFDNRQSKIQNRKLVGIVALVVILAICGARAEAQQPTKFPRIGILIAPSTSFFSVRVEAFRRRLRELRYVEGKTSSLSTAVQKGNSNGFLTLQPNWSVSKLTSSSLRRRKDLF